jgi:hypothetical protein
MRRIQSTTAVSQNPGVPALSGPVGYFTSGNPVAGVPATVVPDWWLNMTQEELAAVVEAAGLLLDGSAGQLLAALRALNPRQMLTYVSSGTFTVPAGITRVKYRIWGGAAGGGGAAGAGSAGGGGGGGGYCEGYAAVTPAQAIPVTVGAGGAGGAPGVTGSSGGYSAFGSFAQANPGSGGIGATGAIGASGGAGGVAAGGQLNLSGQYGGSGFTTGTGLNSGIGGASASSYGGTYANSSTTFATGGNAGGIPAGGGSGGVAGGSGGNGGAGLVIVEW